LAVSFTHKDLVYTVLGKSEILPPFNQSKKGWRCGSNRTAPALQVQSANSRSQYLKKKGRKEGRKRGKKEGRKERRKEGGKEEKRERGKKERNGFHCFKLTSFFFPSHPKQANQA
jgi:hypothetical protein